MSTMSLGSIVATGISATEVSNVGVSFESQSEPLVSEVVSEIELILPKVSCSGLVSNEDWCDHYLHVRSTVQGCYASK